MSSYTQDTKLRLKTKVGESGKSIIEDMYFTPPLKIIDALYEEHPKYGEVANIMLLAVSAGLMDGDTQELDICIGKGSKVILSSQSFEKIHDTNNGKATRTSQIQLEQGAFLDFNPLPVIPFANSYFENSTRVEMQKDCALSYSEIFCAGRVSRGEIFEFKCFSSNLRIYQENKLIFFDNTFLDPSTQNLRDLCYFGDYTHYLNWILVDKNYSAEDFRKKISACKDVNAAVSQNGDVIIIKALAYGSDELFECKKTLLS